MSGLTNFIEGNSKEIDRFISTVAEKAQMVDENSLVFGKIGVALFLGVHGKKVNNTKYIKKAIHFVENAIDEISSSEDVASNLAYGFTGLAYVVNHFNQIGILTNSDIKFLKDIDGHILQSIDTAGSIKTYDLFKGLIGFGVYLKNRDGSVAHDGLKKVIYNLLNLHQSNKDGVCWPTWHQPTQDKYPEYNFGMAHGVPSIISFLSNLKGTEHWTPIIEDILKRTIQFVLAYRQQHDIVGSYYPSIIIPNSKDNFPNKSPLSWCYGDLGVGLAFIHAYKALGDDEILRSCKDFFLHSSKRSIDESMVYNHLGYIEPCLCHGSSGNAYIFLKAFQFLKIEELSEASLYWIKKTFETQVKDDKDPMKFFLTTNVAGVPQMIWRENHSILEGAAGVALIFSSIKYPRLLDWEELFFLNV